MASIRSTSPAHGSGLRLRLAAASLAALLCLGAGGCASNRAHSGTRSNPYAYKGLTVDGYLASDADADTDDNGEKSSYLKPSSNDTYVSKNDPIEADPQDRRAIATLIERYYTAAAAADGARACPLLYSALLAGLDEGGAAGCAAALSSLFKQQHELLRQENVATMVVFDVRVKDGVARALVGFKTTPIGKFDIRREAGGWKIDSLLDTAVSP